MTDNETDELTEIRRRKRQELEQRLESGDAGGEAEESETPTTPIHVDSPAHLNDIVASHDVVLVDFYADWCGPCRMLEPTVEALAAESPAAVAKVDIDALQSLAGQYQVRGVPTLLLFADGQPVERVVGVEDQATLSSLVERYAA